MSPRAVRFVVGEGYLPYVASLWTLLKDDPTLDVDLVKTSDIVHRKSELDGADLLVTVHSSILDVMQTVSDLRGRVPSLTLQDGIIEYRSSARRVQKLFRYRPLHTDFIAVFGDRSKHLLCASGTEAERIFVTGSPRFDHYVHTPAPSDGYVLITMANRPVHKPARLGAFYVTLAQTVNHCRRAGVPYKLRLSRGVKPGGVEAFEPLADLDPDFRELLAEAANSAATSIEEDLQGARAVITTPSTVSLEAMACRRPVGHLLFDCETTFLQTAWTIRCEEDIAEVVDQLLNPPKMKMEFQEVILKENLLFDGKSTVRVAELMRSILNRAAIT